MHSFLFLKKQLSVMYSPLLLQNVSGKGEVETEFYHCYSKSANGNYWVNRTPLTFTLFHLELHS